MAANMTWMGWLGWALLTSLLLGVAVMVIAVRRGNTNCLNVAAIGWIGKRGRSWIALRRSLNVQGKVPHFAHIMEKGDRMVVVDYIPTKPKDRILGPGNIFFAFKGIYRVRRFKLESIGAGTTLKEAARSPLKYAYAPGEARAD